MCDKGQTLFETSPLHSFDSRDARWEMALAAREQSLAGGWHPEAGAGAVP